MKNYIKFLFRKWENFIFTWAFILAAIFGVCMVLIEEPLAELILGFPIVYIVAMTISYVKDLKKFKK